jgi:hypothetical protein
VAVYWVDAVSDDAWCSDSSYLSGISEEQTVCTIGHLMFIDDDCLVIGGSVGRAGDYCMRIKVPRGMVKRVVRMNEAGEIPLAPEAIREVADGTNLQTPYSDS